MLTQKLEKAWFISTDAFLILSLSLSLNTNLIILKLTNETSLSVAVERYREAVSLVHLRLTHLMNFRSKFSQLSILLLQHSLDFLNMP